MLRHIHDGDSFRSSSGEFALMKKTSAFSEASPYKSVAEELERLRKTFRTLNQRYTARVEAEITGLRDAVLSAAEAAPDKSSNGQVSTVIAARQEAVGKRRARAGTGPAERQTDQFHDLRDMLTLLRTFEVSPGVAKRKDFKRVENALEELQLLARHWA